VASAENVPDGAELKLAPSQAADPQVLRARVLWHAADLLPGLPLRGKQCPELPDRVEREVAASR
jgi:hypothetical protein